MNEEALAQWGLLRPLPTKKKFSSKDEVTSKGLKKYFNMELKSLYPLPNIIGVIK
jgi:hypothetical protein